MNVAQNKSEPGAGDFVSVVLPVYNEAESLNELYEKLASAMSAADIPYEMLFVDDGSSDGSFEALARLQKADKKVRVIQLRRNFGKAAAYSAGFRAARGQIVITMDTDLQDDPMEIPRFLDALKQGYDVVVGWKYQGKGPARKSLPSKFFNRMVSLITGIRLHDFNCPFKAYRREVLSEIDVHGELHRYIPVLAAAKGFALTEIKIENLPRRHGKSKYGAERYLRGMFDLLTVIFVTRFAKKPLHLLGLGGMFSCALGFGILFFFVLAHVLFRMGILTDQGWNIHDRPALSLAILLMIVGIQFFSIGLLGELIVTLSALSKDDRAYSIKRALEASTGDDADA